MVLHDLCVPSTHWWYASAIASCELLEVTVLCERLNTAHRPEGNCFRKNPVGPLSPGPEGMAAALATADGTVVVVVVDDAAAGVASDGAVAVAGCFAARSRPAHPGMSKRLCRTRASVGCDVNGREQTRTMGEAVGLTMSKS